MKTLIFGTILAIALILTIGCPVILADDPPTPSDNTSVDITVITPDNLDLDVGITAGGAVNVTVDGYDIDQMAGQVRDNMDAINRLYQAGFINSTDLQKFYSRIIEPLITQLFSTTQTQGEQINLSLQALANLIQSDNLTHQQLQDINQRILDLVGQLNTADQNSISRDSTIQSSTLDTFNSLIKALTDRDNLVNGWFNAEKATSEALRRDLTITYNNEMGLSDHVSHLQDTYLYCFSALGAVVGILLITIIVLIVKIRRLRT